MFLNSRLAGAWAWRVPHLGHRDPISSDARHRPVTWPDTGRGRGLGLKEPKMTRRCFSIRVWQVRGHGVCHALAIEIPFRVMSVTDPLLGQTPAGVEAWD